MPGDPAVGPNRPLATLTRSRSRGIRQVGKGKFHVWTQPDCAGEEWETSYTTWFYFSVQGAAADEVLTFTVVNMNKQTGLYAHDMRPVTRAVPSRPKWQRVAFPTEHGVRGGCPDPPAAAATLTQPPATPTRRLRTASSTLSSSTASPPTETSSTSPFATPCPTPTCRSGSSGWTCGLRVTCASLCSLLRHWLGTRRGTRRGKPAPAAETNSASRPACSGHASPPTYTTCVSWPFPRWMGAGWTW